MDPVETKKMFSDLNEKDLIPGIEDVVQEYNTPTSDPEDTLPVHLISNEGENARINKNMNSSDIRDCHRHVSI